MHCLNFYYTIKPLLPWHLRVAIRRRFALYKRAHCRNTWPILPGSERPPPDWPGWPEGKQFALVLTHDVEGLRGLAKCRSLMKLEEELDFHSSFNFVPEGEYRVSRELRRELARNGFEVGVHDLTHSGRLYRSREIFLRKARRINQYLKEWDAAGFRSGLMLHNLEWLQELNVLYDASTFDTDPFEPQPDGMGRIFPFWVPRSSAAPQSPRRGFVELPYTLPQDSTLFLLFRESTTEVWRRKLDWVAQHGGMALLNVHPDYLRFQGDSTSRRNYPAEFYGQFLTDLRRQYGQSFWHPLPKELATFIAQHHRETGPERPATIDLNRTAPHRGRSSSGECPEVNRFDLVSPEPADMEVHSCSGVHAALAEASRRT